MIDAATVAQAISARLEGGNAWFDGVSIDSRVVRPGELFVAIKGERFDGHEFVAQAFSRGAAAAIVAADRAARLATSAAGGGRSLLAVDDPLQSLGSLAAFWRRRFTLPVVAVVGSNGKTTVKEMTAAILRAAHGTDRVLATAGNLNNHIGLPLMVLRLRAMHLVAVFEIGMNHVGETAQLGEIAQPTIAVLNNAQREHQEFMKSVADVAAEHATILGTLQQGGIAVINADDDYAPFWNEVVSRRNAEGASLTVRDFGLRAPATVIGRVRAQSWGSLVDVAAPEGSVSVDLKLPGRHNVVNALGAIAAATAAGASLDAVAQGLAEFRPIAGRLQIKTGRNGATLIDDTYNANPDSVRAAIAVLVHAAGPKWLVLGDMGEVGQQGSAFHREIGECARAGGVDRLLTLGELTPHAVEAFGPGGEHFASGEELAAAIETDLRPDVTVLVKGSRFMRMERIVAALGGATAAAH
ncbi:MAG TPA: UDP-N-acetylmuramoyl-tripeptide--D-alanyl-D-alanine ligase [Casimicrobiaceae bacterium]|jgi:UDP-N-acetylmuramoyl-tripeptide--D-alanyl-D-alanine ligase|nr:UDP-N-acetylmuramoyl-tripeptide--D-alanyl-D-alanine ligase [Casimicrobiaceae bacterium]